jgi:hypothetical protein
MGRFYGNMTMTMITVAILADECGLLVERSWQDKTDMSYWDLFGPCIFQHKFNFDFPVTESGPVMYEAGEET